MVVDSPPVQRDKETKERILGHETMLSGGFLVPGGVVMVLWRIDVTM